MLACFLFLRHASLTWVPMLATLAVVAGGTASMWLVVSGIKGLITEGRPKRRVTRASSPQRVMQLFLEHPRLRIVKR